MILKLENEIIIKSYLRKYKLDKYTNFIVSNSIDVINFNIEEIKLEDEQNIPIGTSKFGGLPHAPKGFIWPKNRFHDEDYELSSPYLTFIAQFNFSEIKKFDRDNLLPDSGILYIFHYFELQEWEAMQFIYIDSNINDLEIINHPPQHNIPELLGINSYRMLFNQGFTIPLGLTNPFLPSESENSLEDEDEEKYSEMRKEMVKNNIISEYLILSCESIQEKKLELTYDFIN